jgi:hypothetical protein
LPSAFGRISKRLLRKFGRVSVSEAMPKAIAFRLNRTSSLAFKYLANAAHTTRVGAISRVYLHKQAIKNLDIKNIKKFRTSLFFPSVTLASAFCHGSCSLYKISLLTKLAREAIIEKV